MTKTPDPPKGLRPSVEKAREILNYDPVLADEIMSGHVQFHDAFSRMRKIKRLFVTRFRPFVPNIVASVQKGELTLDEAMCLLELIQAKMRRKRARVMIEDC